jgi:hypothetical protein
VVRKRNPALAAIAQTAVAFAAVNGTDLKNRKSISGSVRRGSYRSRISRAVIDSRKNPMVAVENQPLAGPWMIA